MTIATRSPFAAGISLVAGGALLLVCGVGYLVAYYATQGFADAGALSRLGYTNILIALSLLLLGLLLAVVGALLLLVKGRATAR